MRCGTRGGERLASLPILCADSRETGAAAWEHRPGGRAGYICFVSPRPHIYTFSCTQLSVEQAQEHDKQASGDVCKHGPQAHPSSSITPRAIEKYPSRILYLSFPHSITIF